MSNVLSIQKKFDDAYALAMRSCVGVTYSPLGDWGCEGIKPNGLICAFRLTDKMESHIIVEADDPKAFYFTEWRDEEKDEGIVMWSAHSHPGIRLVHLTYNPEVNLFTVKIEITRSSGPTFPDMHEVFSWNYWVKQRAKLFR